MTVVVRDTFSVAVIASKLPEKQLHARNNIRSGRHIQNIYLSLPPCKYSAKQHFVVELYSPYIGQVFPTDKIEDFQCLLAGGNKSRLVILSPATHTGRNVKRDVLYP